TYRIGAEVADDPALAELRVAGRVVGRRDGDRAASPLGRARRGDVETRLVAGVDQELRERERAFSDPRHAHLLDHVVAGRRCVERGYVRRAGEEAPRAGRVLELGLERERPGVRLPADERWFEPLGDIGPHVEPAGTRPAAEPLHAAADCEVD